jgi:hypothetical protein
MTSDTTASAHRPIRKLQADLHIPGILVVGVSALMWAAVAIQSADLQQIQAMLLAKRRMILSSRISPGPRNQDEYDMCCGKGELTRKLPTRHPPAAAGAQLGRGQAASS